MTSHQQQFFQLATHPLKFRMFLLSKLPAAYFSGVRVEAVDEHACTVSVPYKWFTTNPFRSTYFACLAMAAEMSSGVLAFASTYKRQPAISMLVTGIDAVFHSKATGRTKFTCRAGGEIAKVVDLAVATGEAQTITVEATGTDLAGKPVATFHITWSFKKRSS
ncbi:DUF4442 domain-containing protein [Flavihumibacter petaseus]|uniref:DUF4442 domain-containing protein n=1 Tax=Flavihumibacter petaseus NBRC 106054 TaxID=1220578 RepID=A0A0E9N507_9BACT|nr:DUF4442 domain-containing protein [Flavihumibacter petaseus]GAO44781.1 hypothetical protein FPE01S_04_00240 [Flavihumibacter petaseus NBRC 106054]